ncbi:MAG TPA: phosphotransferase family protein [Pseudonocardia sp.]
MTAQDTGTPADVTVNRGADIEPRVSELLAAKRVRRETFPYTPCTPDGVVSGVGALMRASGVADFEITDVQRMAGGASKEQFSFTARVDGGAPERLVLRQDPPESIVETCRYREDELFRALAGIVPTPTTRFIDGDGTHLGQPGLVTTFIDGVTKPPASSNVVSGVGTAFSDEWRAKLVPQFIEHLVAIHDVDWRAADLPHFQPPTGYPEQTAQWQVNWWAQVWRDDRTDAYPLITVAERWLRQRIPSIDVSTDSRDLVLVHGDYRTGNFMFDADTGRFTAVLDWELAHLGDFHEDLGWIVQGLFAGPAEDGKQLACSLLTREDLISRYEAATGRTVDPAKLAFYEMFAAYKLAVMILGTGHSASIRGNNHQDVMLSWLTTVGHTFLGEIARMLGEAGS